MTAQAAMRMRSQLTKVRTLVAASDQAGALRELDAFAATVAEQKSAGRLTASEDAALRSGVARTRARIRVEVSAPAHAPSTSAPTTAPAPTTPQPPPTNAKGKAKGDGKGHGKGHGKGKG